MFFTVRFWLGHGCEDPSFLAALLELRGISGWPSGLESS